MNLFSHLLRLRSVIVTLGLVVLSVVAHAQVVAPPGKVKQNDPAQTALEQTAFRTASANALTLAKAGNLVATEAMLASLNKAKVNTAEWHVELAQRLMQTAEQVARSGQPANVTALANSALSHLAQAQPLTKNVRIQAAAKTLEGTIHEHYLANPTAALTAYQAAAQLSPATAHHAQEAADQLQKVNDNLTAKLNPGH